MINFTQFLELMTNEQSKSWFYIDSRYLLFFTPEELAQVYVEQLDERFVRVFWPREKYKPKLIGNTKPKASNVDITLAELEMMKQLIGE